MPDESNDESVDSVQPPAEEIVAGVSDVVRAALGVGVVLTKAIARATADNKPIPSPRSARGPIDEIVYYGVVAVTNTVALSASAVSAVVRPVISEIGVAVRPDHAEAPDVQRNATDPSAPVPRLPTVRCGAALRITLSIDNPRPEPMMNMAFVCREMKSVAVGAGETLREGAVRFEPTTLSVAPRDFEKLVVFIDTKPDSAPGRYETTIGTDTFETVLQFEVIPAETAP